MTTKDQTETTTSISTPQENSPSIRYAVFIGRWQPLHKGHEWLINQKLSQGIPVLVMVRDVAPDEHNPLTAREAAEIIRARYGSQVYVMVIPDIESVNYGRGVGYEINQFDPPGDIHAISATRLRHMLQGNDDRWKDYIHSSIWAEVAAIYGE